LAEALREPSAFGRARASVAAAGFSELDGEARFARALNAAKTPKTPTPPAASVEIKDAAGRLIGQISASERDVKVTLAKRTGGAFAHFLAERMPGLLDEFRAFEAGDGASKDS
jgi:ParB family chromosome partitioning protein